jgi:hypothetical protein
VNLSTTNRRRLFWFTFGFMGLALSVFAWGLQYKLSLYDPPQSVSHRMPHAKLLSRDEQASSVESPLVGGAKAPSKQMAVVLCTVTFCFFLVALSLPGKPVSPWRALDACRSRHLRRRPSLNVFFFRPPPILA